MTGLILFFSVAYVIGFLSLLFGKKMISVMLAFYAFIETYRFVMMHFPTMEYIMIIAAIVGILAVLLVNFAKNVALFVVGCFIGFTFGQMIVPLVPIQPDYLPYVVLVGCTLLFGLLTKRYSSVLLRYGTAFIGGNIIATTTLLLITNSTVLNGFIFSNPIASMQAVAQYLFTTFMGTNTLWILVIALCLMFAGAFYQKKH